MYVVKFVKKKKKKKVEGTKGQEVHIGNSSICISRNTYWYSG